MQRQPQMPARIGLCLSGGGFRAAAYHLGTLMYLDRVKLLDKVCALSTVSGGTFTGAKYALSRVDKIPAGQFFNEYYRSLKEMRIFPRAIEILAADEPMRNPSKRKDIITCTAHSYAQTLFCKDGEPILFGKILNGATHGLEDISFNATDFRRGYAFRFQKSAKGQIGNRRTRLPPDEAAQIRLADIVASSSCFPAGFEPIEFPNDFHWPKGKMPPEIAKFESKPIPLMDGGVYDNQGIESLEMRVRKKGVDLFFISDTDRENEALYQMPESIAKLVRHHDANMIWKLLIYWNPSLDFLERLSGLLLVMCGISAVVIGMNMWTQFTSKPLPSILWIFFSNILPLILTVATLALNVLCRSVFENKVLSKIPQLKKAGWTHLRQISLVSLIDMCWLRISSLKTLTSDVFMKRIRSKSFRSIYGDPKYENKLVANLIYSIQDSWPFENPVADAKMLGGLNLAFAERLKVIQPPSEKLKATAKSGAEIPTLLWFENDAQLPILVATGQATTCLSLMKFLARTRSLSGDGSFADPAVQTLWQQLCSDWQKFCNDPCWLAIPD